jgi:hypothetical protein
MLQLKSTVLFFFLLTTSHNAAAQATDAEFHLLSRLDSIRKSASVAKHFATIYTETTALAIRFFQYADTAERNFIERLETAFAGYFFRAADADQEGKAAADGWAAYFGDTTLSVLQYGLIGINAHINGDIWQALITTFTPEEIKKHERGYLRFQKILVGQYKDFFDRSVQTHPLTRTLHLVSLGFDKCYGKLMLAKWRKRQLKLALLYFNDPPAFRKQWNKLQQKMKRTNQLILRRL